VYVGYALGQISYVGDEQIGLASGIPNTPSAVYFMSDDRDNLSHYGYLGANYTPLDNLNLNVRGGVQYIDYYNAPAGLPTTDTLAPYAMVSATYTYLPGSYVQFGFNQTRNATSVVQYQNTGTIALDQESSVIYATLNHQFSPKLTGSLVGDIDYATFNGGYYNGQSETYYGLGLNVAYNFNQHLSAEVGYNYDYVSSGVNGQGYNRNRVYLGVTGTY
jgi:Putative beta-barrel porin 2